MLRTPATNEPSNQAQVARGNRPPFTHSINKYAFKFSKIEHIARYDLVANRKIIDLKYMDVGFLKTIRLWEIVYIN